MLDLFSPLDTIQEEKFTPTQVPDLLLLEHYISDDEHNRLLHEVDKNIWSNELKRRVQHYGYKYDYKARGINQGMKVKDLPDWANDIGMTLVENEYFDALPDQLIVNEYLPGQGITDHIDCEPCFEDTVISISLGSYTTMNFTNKYTEQKIPVLLPPKSMVILKGQARYEWMHGIPARRTDIIRGHKRNRERRVSLTFRRVILS